MKGLLYFLLGIVLMVVGGVFLLSNVEIGGYGFYHIGTVNTGAVLIVLFVVFVIAAVVSAKGVFGILAGLDLVMLFVSVLMGTQFRLNRMSAFELVLLVGLFGVGAGFVLHGVLGMYDKKDK